MRNQLFKLLLVACAFLYVGGLSGQVLKYSELPDEVRKEVKKRKFANALKEYKEAKGDSVLIVLPPLDRIYYDEAPVSLGRSSALFDLNSWGRDVVIPAGVVRQRAISECGNYEVIGCIVDSGVDESHSLLDGDWWLAASNYTGQQGKHWHGTHVAGIVFQVVAEVAKARKNIQFKDVQILNVQGSGSFSSAAVMAETETATFANHLEKGGGVVMNNSWGYDGPPVTVFERAVQKSKAAGVCWIGSAGNAGREIDGYPGMSVHFTSVASVAENLKRSPFSTMNRFVDVAAPGSNINSTLPNNRQAKASGTSMASPFVAGIGILAYGKYGPVLQGGAMNVYLNYVTTDVPPEGRDNETGHGITYVLKMLDTHPCDVPGIDCDGSPEPPNPPDEPEEPTDPGPAQNTVAFESNRGHVMRYRKEGQADWSILVVPDLKVSISGAGSQAELQADAQRVIDEYFNFRGIVITEEMGFASVVEWTGHFLEFVSRNNGFPIQVALVEGYDEFGHSAIVEQFDRADTEEASKVQLVDLSDHREAEASRLPQKKRGEFWYRVKAVWSVETTIGDYSPAITNYTFDDRVGVFYSYISSRGVPSENVIKAKANPPFEGAEIHTVLDVIQLK